MLNILKKNLKKLNNKALNPNYNNHSLNTKYTKENSSKEIKLYHKMKEYNNVIYRPTSSKEWFGSVYSFNKSYIKPLVALDVNLNKLFKSYCNMLLYKIKNIFKRRRHNKTRYSANRIYVSGAELKHTNNKLIIILYTYNKQKSLLERYLRNIILLIRSYKLKSQDDTKLIVAHKDKIFTIFKSYTVYKSKKVSNNEGEVQKFTLSTFTNRLIHLIKDNFFVLNKWNMTFFRFKNNLLNYLVLNLKRNNFYNIPTYNIILLKNLFKFQNLFFDYTKSINFNKSKFNNLVLSLRNLGLIHLIHKIYDKKIEIKVVELKSIHLNSDVFSSAVALKLRDRHNKAVNILRRAILQMVKIPDLHTLITFDDNIETMNKNNIVKTIKQQVVSGVRFEASGRLTRRLTAMRAIFKYRYVGSLKNLRASYNSKASAMSRGYVKANAQYTMINSKTRNGTFGLKGWVSSH